MGMVSGPQTWTSKSRGHLGGLGAGSGSRPWKAWGLGIVQAQEVRLEPLTRMWA